MDSLLRPDIFSGNLKVKKITDLEGDENFQRAYVELDAHTSNDFIKRWEADPSHTSKIINSRVNYAVVGIDIEPDYESAETKTYKGAKNGRISLPATLNRVREGIPIGPLSKTLSPVDSLLARIAIIDPEDEVTDEERRRIIKEIHKYFPKVAQILDPEDSTFSLAQIEELASIRGQGIDEDDIQKFLFGLRSPNIFESIVERMQYEPPLRHFTKEGDSALYTIQGFTHPDAIGVFQDTENAKLVGTRIIFPRSNIELYQTRFFMRLAILKALYLDEIGIPVRFYRAPGKNKVTGYNGTDADRGFEKLVESFSKVDREILPSFPATSYIFEVMKDTTGGRKAVFIRDQKDFERIMSGDQSMVKSFKPIVKRTIVNPLSLAEDPDLPHHTESLDPKSFAEIQLLEGDDNIESDVDKEGKSPSTKHGVLFCKYFPNKDVLRQLYQHANKLRAIVFQAPSYDASKSVEKGKEDYPMEGHIFFSAEKFVAIREFHKKFPDIKLIWSHPGLNRNLIFVDDGKIPMFTKPEVAHYLLNPDSSLRISFCGSSTEKPEMDEKEKARVYEEEKAFTRMYCEFARGKGKMPMGINGGGPDVMERNGEHLQELGAVSVASACDLGFAGQKRHTNWDAVLNFAGDSTAFTLREEVLLGGDIIHIAPGGIGSIEEIMVVLAQNKVGMAKKFIFLIGKQYWRGQIQQFVESAAEGNIKAHHLSRLFVVDKPEEVNEILENIDKDEDFLKKTTEYWDNLIKKTHSSNQS